MGGSGESRKGIFRQTATEELCPAHVNSAGRLLLLIPAHSLAAVSVRGYVKEQRGRKKWGRLPCRRIRAPAPGRGREELR